MRSAVFVLLIVLAGCASGPPRIAKGTPCARCGMAVAELRFACESRREGAWRTFDSIECLIADRKECRLILLRFKFLWIDQPEIIHPRAWHHLRQPRAIDQPLRLRIGTDERRRKKFSEHQSTSRVSLHRFKTHFENAGDEQSFPLAPIVDLMAA